MVFVKLQSRYFNNSTWAYSEILLGEEICEFFHCEQRIPKPSENTYNPNKIPKIINFEKQGVLGASSPRPPPLLKLVQVPLHKLGQEQWTTLIDDYFLMWGPVLKTSSSVSITEQKHLD